MQKAIYSILEVKIIKGFIFVLIILGLLSCSDSSSRSKNENKQILLKELLHNYSEDRDSLKRESVFFLIKNMHNNGYLAGNKLTLNNELFSILHNKSEDWKKAQPWYSNAIKKIMDSLANEYGHLKSSDLEYCTDIQNLSSEFLITHIDEAFEVWQKPWTKHLSFEQFCEYILPYRCFNEAPEYWRLPYKEKFSIALNNIVDSANTLAVGAKINEIAKPYFSTAFDYFPGDISALNMLKSKYGNCSGNAAYKLFAMRSLGIPAVVDFIPMYGNNPNRHYWNSTLDQYGNPISFEEPLNDPNSEVPFLEKFTLTKVFRKTYALQSDKTELLKLSKNDVPLLFHDLKFKDVTQEYLCVSDIKLKLSHKPLNALYAYLCVFNNQGWQPVHFSKVARDSTVIFTCMGRNVVYAPMYYIDGNLISAGEAFYISKKGWIQPFAPKLDSVINMQLTRKFNMVKRKENWLNTLIGAEFQAANNIMFKDAVTLYAIDKRPSQYKESVAIVCNKSFRYFRLLFNEDSTIISGEYDGACIAEIEFIDKKGNKLKGHPIFKEGRKYLYYLPENCFDGNALTFYEDTREINKKYIGLDMGRPVSISTISFQARNDLNNVQIGDKYELFYWYKGSFIAFEKQVAIDTVLNFRNVPANTLYWLRNLSSGSEERIFTYENEEQVWW